MLYSYNWMLYSNGNEQNMWITQISKKEARNKRLLNDFIYRKLRKWAKPIVFRDPCLRGKTKLIKESH